MVLTDVILPVFLIIALGFALRKYGKADLRTFSRAQLYVLSPALVFMSLAKPEAGAGIVLKILAYILVMEACIFLLSQATGLIMKGDRTERQAISLTSMFMNSGFYGIPVCMLAFGERGLTFATIYMVASSITQSTLGIFIASVGRRSVIEAVKSIFAVPLIWAIVASRLLVHWNALPSEPWMKMINLLGSSAIPLGLLLLGMQLESITVETPPWKLTSFRYLWDGFSNGNGAGARCPPAPAESMLARDIRGGLVAGGLRIMGGLAAALLILGFFGFDPGLRQVLIVQSSMPSAVNAVVYAMEFDCRARLVAIGILASTLASVVSIVLILKYIV